MKPWLIFTDIDGTLVDNEQQVSNTNRRIIKKLLDDGNQFYLATGRMLASAQIIAEDIDPRVNIIASNGAIFSLNGQIHQHHLGRNALMSIYQVGQELTLSAFFFTDHQVLYTHSLPHYFKHSDQNRIASPNPADYIQVKTLSELVKFENQITNAIIIEDKDLNRLDHARTLLKQEKLQISSSSSNNIEIIPAGVNKATAIQEVCSSLKQDVRHTMAFGDGQNDLEMLNQVTVSVAMENASNIVKSQATYTTTSNLNDGIAQFLVSYFKGELINE